MGLFDQLSANEILAITAGSFFLAVALISWLVLRERWARKKYRYRGDELPPKKSPPPYESMKSHAIMDATDRVRQFLDMKTSMPDALGWSSVPEEEQSEEAETGEKKEEAAKETAEGHPATAAKNTLGLKKTILIADDDPVVSFALQRRLQLLGFNVLRSPDSSHALFGAMKVKPDLLILDVNMPGGNGLAVCEMMASDPVYSSIPVLIHTSLNDPVTKERSRALGAHYVEKTPNSWLQLRTLIHNLLGGSEVETAEAGGETAAVAKPSDLLTATCGHARVLCLDDSRESLEALRRQLISRGVEVFKTHDAEECFWTCFTEKPHIVVVQGEPPWERLLETLFRFAQHPVTRSLPILVIGRKDEMPVDKFPATQNFTVLDPSIGLPNILSELEKIVPVAKVDEDIDPLARAMQGGVASEPVAEVSEPSTPEPVAADESEEEHPTEKPHALRILCIDDDPTIAKAVALRVQPYGIEVKSAENGTAGFYTGLRERPDLILLDLNMPQGEGNYILGRFRDHPLTKDIPIVILTVETNAGVRRELISHDASGFLTKPVRWKEFFMEIARWVPLPKRLLADYEIDLASIAPA